MHSAADDVNEGVINLIRAFRREPRKRRVGCFVLVVLGEHTRRPPIHKLTTTLGCFRTHAFLRVFDGSSGVMCREGAKQERPCPGHVTVVTGSCTGYPPQYLGRGSHPPPVPPVPPHQNRPTAIQSGVKYEGEAPDPSR